MAFELNQEEDFLPKVARVGDYFNDGRVDTRPFITPFKFGEAAFSSNGTLVNIDPTVEKPFFLGFIKRRIINPIENEDTIKPCKGGVVEVVTRGTIVVEVASGITPTRDELAYLVYKAGDPNLGKVTNTETDTLAIRATFDRKISDDAWTIVLRELV